MLLTLLKAPDVTILVIHSMELTSSSFSDSAEIPTRFSCEGDNINPQLGWSDVPSGTQSFVLIMEDPDVPRNLRPDGLFIHWMIWNIPATVKEIPEHTEPAGVAGLNTAGQIGYRGPCPPHGSHRYYFRLYALDCELTIPSTVMKGELLQAMQSHILDQAELMGRYKKKAE